MEDFTGGSAMDSVNGITKRDFFAAFAMLHFMKFVEQGVPEASYQGPEDFAQAAELSFDMADFMLLARKDKPRPNS
jgi:hypothetical protein